ncbi:DEKNAAC104347 [Brettanomyces naardenensis]|uniref:DEKNAAC104347 n=1 Tax=Brettanomyces naardenensis TaxID=13370 RepID=A0A448YQR8_BRENA|nr:DEKNAAC104347 [Brettanomyces naardenensis]
MTTTTTFTPTTDAQAVSSEPSTSPEPSLPPEHVTVAQTTLRIPQLSEDQLRDELKGLRVEKNEGDTDNPLDGTILNNALRTNPNEAPLPDEYIGSMTNKYAPYELYRVVKKTYGNGSKVPRATLFTLVRNSELFDILESIQRLENRFNGRMNYDWVFMNDEPFSDQFIELTSAMVSGTARYGIIPREHWSYPEWIDQDKARAVRESRKFSNIIYGSSESYRHMCRYNSMFFYKHPIMNDYDLYWRVEPNVDFMCDILEDPFRYMEETQTQYGFTIAFQEIARTVETLWERSMGYFLRNDTVKNQLPESNLLGFVSDDEGKSYNMCHFWTNFEIANLNFYRSEMYNGYVEYLDRFGGYFYERWGDAPIHSIAASLMLKPEKVHVFGNIAYRHTVSGSCPLDDELIRKARCTCDPKRDWTISSPQPCNMKYLKVSGQKTMKDFDKYVGLLEEDRRKEEENRKKEREMLREATRRRAEERREKEERRKKMMKELANADA